TTSSTRGCGHDPGPEVPRQAARRPRGPADVACPVHQRELVVAVQQRAPRPARRAGARGRMVGLGPLARRPRLLRKEGRMSSPVNPILVIKNNLPEYRQELVAKHA